VVVVKKIYLLLSLIKQSTIIYMVIRRKIGKCMDAVHQIEHSVKLVVKIIKRLYQLAVVIMIRYMFRRLLHGRKRF